MRAGKLQRLVRQLQWWKENNKYDNQLLKRNKRRCHLTEKKKTRQECCYVTLLNKKHASAMFDISSRFWPRRNSRAVCCPPSSFSVTWCERCPYMVRPTPTRQIRLGRPPYVEQITSVNLQPTCHKFASVAKATRLCWLRALSYCCVALSISSKVKRAFMLGLNSS